MNMYTQHMDRKGTVMKTKYMSREDRKKAKHAARARRKAMLHSFTPKELKTYRKSGKGLAAYAEEIGKLIPKG